MGRGRTGVGYKRWAHIRIKLEKINFEREMQDASNSLIQNKWKRWERLAKLARGEVMSPEVAAVTAHVTEAKA